MLIIYKASAAERCLI